MTLSEMQTLAFIPLGKAHYCETCQGFHNSPLACPRCASETHSTPVAPIWDRPAEQMESDEAAGD